MRQRRCFDLQPVERTRHDHKRPVSALRRLFAEGLVKFQQLAERRASAHVHDAAVVFRSLRGESVRSVRLQLVRKVPACDQHRPRSGVLDGSGDQLPQPVMVAERQSGQTDAYKLPARIFLPDEPQRHHRAVIERRVPLAERARGEILRIRELRDTLYKRRVVPLRKPHAARAKLPERTGRAAAGRDVKVIRVHDGMRTGDDQRVRLERGDLIGHALV